MPYGLILEHYSPDKFTMKKHIKSCWRSNPPKAHVVQYSRINLQLKLCKPCENWSTRRENIRKGIILTPKLKPVPKGSNT